ncbi:glucose-1-phosphate thymidylyltransferase [Candidatus Planktophila dulcis]|uniref:sugar nucleotidyltransferase n=1 Tax=Candidatus Planktophila dulcis TaxID=1884914 RepID=UPI000BAC726C|nr:sugar phosphate nucleotidyltransferase [Candidatus Planktophila dulcis]ASY20711.1 glucose-1-phosphate thymidylyltransferase [Candidatus Planktophila dulcis]
MKAILLAGGTGTRIWPLSAAVNKHLLPVYDKPMIYYPLTTLMLAGASEILVITAREAKEAIEKLLGNGSKWGLSITYAIQERPGGIPEAFILAPEYFRDNSVILMLGDNLLYGMGLGESLNQNSKLVGGKIFAYKVSNPEEYGVVVLGPNGQPTRIVEKPDSPISNLAIPGLYFFDSSVYDRVQSIQPSRRGELEIVDILNSYLEDQLLQVQVLERGTAWLDTGNPKSLLAAGEFVKVIEDRQGLKIGCPEEVALRTGFISIDTLEKNLREIPDGEYKNYLKQLLL